MKNVSNCTQLLFLHDTGICQGNGHSQEQKAILLVHFLSHKLPVGVLLKARPQNRLLLLENIIVNQKYQHDRIPRLTCTFLYQHFKRTSHSHNNVIVQPVEKIPYVVWNFLHWLNYNIFSIQILPLDSKTSNDLKLNLNG